MKLVSKSQVEYSEKLKDPRWQKKRLEIFQRDNWRCRFCRNEDKTLSVHHKVYISDIDPWDYPDELLITLCEDCHQKEAETIKLATQQIMLSLAKNFDAETILEVAKWFDAVDFKRNKIDSIDFYETLQWFLTDQKAQHFIVDLYDAYLTQLVAHDQNGDPEFEFPPIPTLKHKSRRLIYLHDRTTSSS